jgi:pyruvate dehydrogenase E2 component (dihydrolipoamide acetyltransferase)
MKIEVQMPKMGESLQEGTITKWIKKEGEMVERDEPILEISTDKVDTEVPSPNSGKLVKILFDEGETVEVGTVIAHLNTDGDAEVEESAPAEEPETKEAESAPEPEETETEEEAPAASGDGTELVMPKMGESLQEGTITKWLKQVGDKIERDEPVLEISTDKVDTEVPSPVDGVLSEILVEEGETVEVGTVIAMLNGGGGSAKPKAKTEAPKKEEKSETPAAAKESKSESSIEVPQDGGTKEIPSRKGDKFFSPLVRTIAEDKGVTLEELEQIKGTGADGRVTKNDLLAYIDNRGEVKSAPAQKATEKPAAEPKKSTPAAPKTTSYKAPDIPTSGDDVEVIPMDRVRQLISEHMVYSKHTSAHVTSVAEADITEMVRFREKHKNDFQKREGFKLTYTPFLTQAALDAVKENPMVNVSVDGKNIIRHKKVNLGMATALPDGNLIVPVIKNADVLNTTGVARAINDLATRARSKKLSPDDIQGGTITLTNVGAFGTLFGTPVINQPQVAIFGVGAIKKRAIVKEVEGNDLILVRHMIYVSITYDHRVIDGMLAGQTLSAFVRNLESMNESNLKI